jgi:hypothetical protein
MSDASNTQSWYIIKRPTGNCEIVGANIEESSEVTEKWGPFESQSDAFARRVGLIRAGKCQPK